MPLGMEVGLGPEDSVKWGPSSPPHESGTEAFTFWLMSFRPTPIVAKQSPISATTELLFGIPIL